MGENSFTNSRMHTLMSRYLQEECWDLLCDEFPALLALSDCLQDPRHHGEGDVATHTKMVLGHLISDPEFKSLSDDDRFLIFWTCVFHDVGKPARTKIDSDGNSDFHRIVSDKDFASLDSRKQFQVLWDRFFSNGTPPANVAVTSRGHSKTGASIARVEMMKARMPFEMREHMCSLISAHQIPFWLYERSETDQTRKAICLSLELNPKLLSLHARADAKGRVCNDPEDILLRVQLSTEVFKELGILDKPYEFPNDASKVDYFMLEGRHHAYEAFEKFNCEVTVMSGLPGSGKDTWLSENAAHLPVVSLDDIRIELGVEPTDNQGTVIQEGLERARGYLRSHTDFAWNSTNLTMDQRSKIATLLHDYSARFRFVYIETAPDTQIAQNANRDAAVYADVIENMRRKLDPPKDWEAHEVIRVIDLERKFKKKSAANLKR